MSLGTTIQNSLAGLRATQAGLEIVSQNVSNAGTVGYTRRTLITEQQVANGRTIGVDVKGASRTLDTLIQRQLRLEQAGAAYSSTRASAQASLTGLFDKPGGVGTMPTLFSTLASKLSALANNPSSQISQAEIISSASDLAGSLNALSGQVQDMRQDSERALASAVEKADTLIQRIAKLNGSIGVNNGPALQDQRDALVDQLSELMDVKAKVGPTGAVSLTTTGGLTLVEGETATRLSFDAHTLGPGAVYSTDPAKRTVGTITATDSLGTKRDVVASGLIRSGEIAAQLDLRDTVLTQAQSQLDELAAGLASALSDKQISGTAATSGAQTGFDLDLASLAAGNRFSVEVTDPAGTSRTLVFARTDSASGKALANEAGVIGIDFSGPAAVAAQIQTALGGNYAVSNPSGSTMRILNNGTTSQVKSAQASSTQTALANGNLEVPLFVDGGRGGAAYTGTFEGGTSQLAGFASRITVNQAIRNDPTVLSVYGPTVPNGDSARANQMFDRLTKTDRTFAGTAGINGSNAPWTGTVADFAQAMVATQAQDSVSATNLDAGQQIVLSSFQGKYSDKAGVNMDTELTQLIQLQTAYGANARLLTAANDMMNTLLRIGG